MRLSRRAAATAFAWPLAGLIGMLPRDLRGGSPAMTSIDVNQAAAIAAREIKDVGPTHDFVILDDKTEEHPFGWVFFYVPRRYLETRNPNDLVPGNGPLVVERDGRTTFLPTSVPPPVAIAEYERGWRTRAP
jgi:hypothetical protein